MLRGKAVNPIMKRGYGRQHYPAQSAHRWIKGYSKIVSRDMKYRDGVCVKSNHLNKNGEGGGNGLWEKRNQCGENVSTKLKSNSKGLWRKSLSKQTHILLIRVQVVLD